MKCSEEMQILIATAKTGVDIGYFSAKNNVPIAVAYQAIEQALCTECCLDEPRRKDTHHGTSKSKSLPH
jgi:hypothetical protein